MTIQREDLAEGLTLYCGDCRDVLPTLGRFDAIVTDPPYGMNATSAINKGGQSSRWSLASAQSAWDSKPFSWDSEAPSIVATFPDRAEYVIIWGGQFFIGLPTARGWLVWNKIIRNFSSGVCELAWTNLDEPIDCFDYSHGQLAAEGKAHPMQKPLPLMRWCLQKLPADTLSILDPFMGSGTTGVAAVGLGKIFTGIEREPRYFDVACRRISDALARPDLFVVPPKPIEKQEALL